MVQVLRGVRQTGEVPPEHRSHDHLNAQVRFSFALAQLEALASLMLQDEMPITDAQISTLTKKFEEFSSAHRTKDEQIIWGIVDGFLLYWHPVRLSRDIR